MTADQLVQEIGSLWDALALAGQGAFSNAHPANGHKSPRDQARALQSFADVAAVANTHLAKLSADFAVRLGAASTKALIDIEQERQKAIDAIAHVFRQLAVQVVRAIRSGSVGGPGALIAGAHGGIGMLVGRQAGILQISVRDAAARQWKSPRRLVETIARDFTVQAQVIAAISNLRAQGHERAYVGQDEYELSEIEAQRATLFHPNSKELPRASDLHA